MKKFACLIAFVLVLAIAGAAAAESIAILYPDTVDDKGWCQTMDMGVKAAIEMGYDIEYTPVESVSSSDAPNTLEQLADNYDIIICHAATYTAACVEAAEEYPDQVFALGTSDKVLGDNIFTYIPQSEEPGYINGLVAGLTTKVKKVGIVGSSDAGDSARYVRGFVKGLMETCPDAEYMLSWTGSFSDTVGAGDIGKTFIESGCDVMVGPAQQALGALRLVDSAEGILWMGQTVSQMTDFPKVVTCAADYDYSAIVKAIVDRVREGKMGGENIPLNYNNGGFIFEFSADENLMPAETKAVAEAAIEVLKAAPNTVDFARVELK